MKSFKISLIQVNEAGGEIYKCPLISKQIKNVAEFYDLIINKKDFESARRFMADRYKQHKTPKVQRAIIEIFRLENGKIDVHWNVIQEIPETLANPNGMF